MKTSEGENLSDKESVSLTNRKTVMSYCLPLLFLCIYNITDQVRHSRTFYDIKCCLVLSLDCLAVIVQSICYLVRLHVCEISHVHDSLKLVIIKPLNGIFYLGSVRHQ